MPASPIYARTLPAFNLIKGEPGLYRYTDGGVSWTPYASELVTGRILRVAAKPGILERGDCVPCWNAPSAT